MADKEVRVRITGDMSDLLKKLKALEDAFNELGDKNTDNKGINSLIEDLERAQRETEELGENFNDIYDASKKLDNTGLSDMSDDLSKANENMNDFVDSAKNINKHLDNIDGLDNIVDDAEKATNAVKDFNRQLDNIDKIDSINAFDDMADDAEKVAKAVGDIGDKIKATDSTVWEDINSYMDSMYEKAPKISEAMSEMGQNISDGFKIDLDSIKKDSGKIGEIFTSSLLEAGLEGKMIGDIVSSSIKEAIGDTEKAMENFSEALIPEEAIKNFDELIKKLIKVQDTYDDTAKQIEELNEKKSQLEAEREAWLLIGETELESAEKYVDAMERAKKELDDYQAQLNNLNEEVDKYNNKCVDWANRNEAVTKALEEQRKVVQDLQKDYNESAEGVKDYDKVLNDLVERVRDVGKSFDDLSFDSKLAKGLSNELKNMNFDSFKDGFYKLNYACGIFDDTLDKVYSNLEKCNDEFKKIESLSNISDEVKDLARQFNNLWDSLDEGAEVDTNEFREILDALDRLTTIEAGEPFDKLTEGINKWVQKTKQGLELFDKLDDGLGKIDDIATDNSAAMDEYSESIDKVREAQEKLNKLQEEQGKLDQLEKEKETLDAYGKELEEIGEALKDAQRTYGDTEEAQNRMTESLKENYEATKKALEEYEKSQEAHREAGKRAHELSLEIKQLDANLKAMGETLAEGNKLTKEQADGINEQYKAYERLSKRVKAYLENEENGILLREKVAKSFKETSDAMEKIYDGSKKLNNFDLVNKTLEEAAEHVKELNIVDTKNLQRDLARLGDLIEDKTDKIKRFKEINKEFGTDASKIANWLDKESKSLRDNADATKVVVEAVDTLRDAWGDIKVGDEDHLKLRARSELLNDYGDTLKENIKYIRNYYHELQTLDEIYEQATDKEKQTIDDYRTWEKNKEALKEYNDAIRDYFDMLRDTGGKIDDKFLNDAGNFDVKKFIDDYDRLGTAMMVLTKQANAMKQQVLESLQAEKESIENKRKLAKETLELAQANKEAAKEQYDSLLKTAQQSKSYEEQQKAIKELADANEKLKKATEELARAEKDYADINDNANDEKRIQNAKDLVKQYNEQAEALRKLGAAVKDIDLDDIRDFDKSLGTNLKDIFDIDKDIPKTFKDFVEDIKAMFTELGDFDFGGAGDIFKDLGKGLLDALPADIKAATAMFTALTTAVNKLYEAGKQQFFEGLTNIGGMLEPVWDMITNVGDEVRDAFENITGMDLDLGSLIEQVVEFEGTITKAGVAADATEKDIARLESKARELGATSRYSATDVATAMDELATAGWSTQEILDGIQGVVNLSEGSFIDLGDAAEFVANGLTSLGMNAGQASDFVDIVSQSAVKTSTDVNQMQRAFTNAASVAGTLGISATDLGTALGLMADQGVKGAKAGTALKNLMANMAAPTEKMTKCLEKYNLQGVQSAIVNGDLMGGVIKLKQAFDDNNLSMKDQLEIITTLAGKHALPGIAALMNNTTEEMNKLRFEVDSSTKSSRAYAESLGLVDEKGNMVAETYQEMVTNNAEAYEKWQNFNKVLSESADYMTMVGGSTTDLGAIVHKLGEDGEVTADQVGNLVEVFYKMKGASKETVDTLNEYGIKIAETEEGVFDFGETIKNLGEVWDDLTETEKQQLLSQLGVKTSVAELNELFSDEGDKIEELIDAYENMQGVSEHLARSFDSTVKGALLNLASAMEEQCLQAFDSLKEGILDAAQALTEFFNIWNGLSDLDVGSGFIAALAYLSEEIKRQSEGWGEALKNGIINAVKGLDSIINSSTFDNILEIGTNIITGICEGIQKAKENGSLDSAIDGAIQKICNWIETNGPQIEEAGKTIIDSLKSGIERNSDSISAALDTLCSVINTWASSSAQLESTAAIFADKFVNSFVESTTKSLANKGGEIIQAITSVLNPGMQDYYEEGGGKQLTDQEKFFEHNAKGGFLVDWIKGGVQKAKEWLFGESYAAELGEEIGTQVTEGYNNKLVEGKETTNATANEIGTGISEGIGNALLSMDVSQLQLLQTEMTNLQTTTATVATGMATSFTNIQNTARTSFMGLANIVRNQMLNVSNIVRNQLLNCTNIVNNQCTNMANTFRTQFVNMANIVNNQFTNMANNIRTQMVNCTNIVTNQCTNMANAFRTQFVNMANIANNQFTNIANSIRTQMVNCTNIITNQCTNMANAFRTQFVNMANIVNNQFTNIANNIRTQMVNCTNIINNQCTNMANTFRTQFVNMANIANNQITNIANNIRTQMTNCTNIVKNQCTNMANTFRTQMVNMANIANNQFTNVANNVRTQMTNCTNIIRNQCTNMANSFRTEFVNMANIAKNQMTNITNVIRTQATQWSSTVKSQSSSMKSAFTSAFSGLSSIAASQMAKCLSTVRSYMSQIKAAVSQKLTLNVGINKTVTTTNITKTKPASASYAIRAINASAFALSAPKAMATGYNTNNDTGGGAFSRNKFGNGPLSLEVPLYLDGREIARASATYTQDELNKLEKRSKRKRGE